MELLNQHCTSLLSCLDLLLLVEQSNLLELRSLLHGLHVFLQYFHYGTHCAATSQEHERTDLHIVTRLILTLGLHVPHDWNVHHSVDALGLKLTLLRNQNVHHYVDEWSLRLCHL